MNGLQNGHFLVFLLPTQTREGAEGTLGNTLDPIQEVSAIRRWKLGPKVDLCLGV
jgi:hypothetical protein